MMLLRNATCVKLNGVRYISSYLKWPLPEAAFHGDSPDRMSEHLHSIESHWKEAIRNPSAAPSCTPGKGQHKYVLSMFPYPSGNLHMGHMRVYTISDVTARYYRLNGYNVIHPIGWDAFGLPAENAARDRGVDPKQWTQSNIATMRQQLLKTGVQFDWERELSTCEPDFYKWTQWIFCKLHEKRLLRRNLAEVNWDPVDGTVLAAEQIDSSGNSWRSGVKAEKRKLRQWMVETPKYAKRLYDGLKNVTHWHDVASIQSNWIGQCDAYRFMFPLKDNESGVLLEEILDLRLCDPLAISKTPFIIIRQGHSLSDPDKKDKEPYVSSISVLNGVTGKWLPIVVVPSDYEGPQMNLDVRCADSVADASLCSLLSLDSSPATVMPMNLNDVTEIAAFGGYGGYLTSRTLQDWVVSRQRGWGTPIPMILSEDGKTAVPIQEDQLPLIHGQGGQRIETDRLPDGFGFIEKDTLDTYFDSSWYYLRYLDSRNSKELISKQARNMMPVDVYVGGVEHAAVHMFFARFICHFLADIGVAKEAEPFKELIPQGIVRGKTFLIKSTGRYIKNEQVIEKDGKMTGPNGEELEVIYEKMSKSKHNGVDPLLVLERDGVDRTRLQLLDAAAPRQPINWGDADLKGLNKWIDRVSWVVSSYISERKNVLEKNNKEKAGDSLESALKENYNYFVRNVSMCLEVLHLHNTAIARLQGLTNALRKINPTVLGKSREAERCLHALIIMMQVFAPHSAAELWSAVRSVQSINSELILSQDLSSQPWPQVDPDANIDFMFIVNDISCGRIATPRKEIENLTFEETFERAKTAEHAEIIERMEMKGYKFEKMERTARDGFHVTLSATLSGDIASADISSLLDTIQAERRKANKKNKKEKHKVVTSAS